MRTTLASGRKARPARPPAIRIVPAAARASTAGTLDVSGAAASAASGITVTAAAAAIGVSRQPSISSRTTRKSAAASAAEINARARFAATCGRIEGAARGSRRPSPRTEAATGTATASATGTWTKKIDCQETSSVSRPPIPGPSAAPAAPAAAQTARRVALRADDPRQHLERRADGRRTAEGLYAARQQQQADTVGETADETRRPRTTAAPRTPAAPPRPALAASETGSAASASTRLKATSTQVTDCHRDVELAVDLGQREDDDRGVGEDEGDRDGQRRAQRALGSFSALVDLDPVPVATAEQLRATRGNAYQPGFGGVGATERPAARSRPPSRRFRGEDRLRRSAPRSGGYPAPALPHPRLTYWPELLSWSRTSPAGSPSTRSSACGRTEPPSQTSYDPPSGTSTCASSSPAPRGIGNEAEPGTAHSDG